MREDFLIQRLREAIRKRGMLSPQERFEEMVRLGVIDRKGRALLRFPQPPRRKKPKARS
jgi:hypothetical protein